MHVFKVIFGFAFITTNALITATHAHPLEEVPFITSPDNVTLEMLNNAGVKRGDHVIDLDSGDGRIVILAAAIAWLPTAGQLFFSTGLAVSQLAA